MNESLFEDATTTMTVKQRREAVDMQKLSIWMDKIMDQYVDEAEEYNAESVEGRWGIDRYSTNGVVVRVLLMKYGNAQDGSTDIYRSEFREFTGEEAKWYSSPGMGRYWLSGDPISHKDFLAMRNAMKDLIVRVTMSVIPEATVEVGIEKIVGTRAVTAYITIPYEVFTGEQARLNNVEYKYDYSYIKKSDIPALESEILDVAHQIIDENPAKFAVGHNNILENAIWNRLRSKGIFKQFPSNLYSVIRTVLRGDPEIMKLLNN